MVYLIFFLLYVKARNIWDGLNSYGTPLAEED
jgi:hypothetical protein